jgi:hypothetical protein
MEYFSDKLQLSNFRDVVTIKKVSFINDMIQEYQQNILCQRKSAVKHGFCKNRVLNFQRNVRVCCSGGKVKDLYLKCSSYKKT